MKLFHGVFLLFSCTFDFDSSSPCKAFVSEGKLRIQSQRAQGHILHSRVSILNLAGTCDSFFALVSMLLNGWRATDRVEGTTHTTRLRHQSMCDVFLCRPPCGLAVPTGGGRQPFDDCRGRGRPDSCLNMAVGNRFLV